MVNTHHRSPGRAKDRRTILLLGIGHTHAEVLRRWASAPIDGHRLVCLSRFEQSAYSGMLPAALSGQVDAGEMLIDLKKLTGEAGAELITEPVDGLDRQARRLRLRDGRTLEFDLLSIGIGSVPSGIEPIATAPFLIPVKPMQTFLPRLGVRLSGLAGGDPIRVAVVGGGAAGVEIACCIVPHLKRAFPGRPLRLDLFTVSDRLANDLHRSASKRLKQHLLRVGFRLHFQTRVVDVHDQQLTTDRGEAFRCDALLWVTGASPPPLIERLDLTTDESGFLATRDTLQSVDDERLFAVGDCGSIVGKPFAKAGVYAVRQSPVLWNNLNAMARGGALQSFQPQSSFLKLINTGDGRAVLDFRGAVFHSRWCWKLKRRIDRSFVRRFQT